MSDELQRDLERARELIALKRDAAALDLLTRLLGENPDAAGPVQLLFAVAHSAAGRRAEAVASARLCVAAEPEWDAAHYVLGTSLREAGRQRDALGALECASAITPDWSEPHQQRAMVLADLTRGREAIDAAQAGLDLAPDDPEAHFAFGYVLHDANPAAAQQAYAACLGLDPQHAGALHNLATLRLQGGEVAAGARGLADVLAQSPQAGLPLTVLDQHFGVLLQRVHLLTFGCLWVFAMLGAGAATQGSTPGVAFWLLVAAHVGAAFWAVRIVRRRLHPLLAALPRRGDRYLRELGRRDPLAFTWLCLLALTWLGFALGLVTNVVVIAVGGGAASSSGTLAAVGVGFLALLAGAVVSWLRVPALKRRARRQKFLP